MLSLFWCMSRATIGIWLPNITKPLPHQGHSSGGRKPSNRQNRWLSEWAILSPNVSNDLDFLKLQTLREQDPTLKIQITFNPDSHLNTISFNKAIPECQLRSRVLACGMSPPIPTALSQKPMEFSVQALVHDTWWFKLMCQMKLKQVFQSLQSLQLLLFSPIHKYHLKTGKLGCVLNGWRVCCWYGLRLCTFAGSYFAFLHAVTWLFTVSIR